MPHLKIFKSESLNMPFLALSGRSAVSKRFRKLVVIFFLRWLEIVSWCARPGPLIARACASTPGSRRCKFSDLVTLENFAKFIFRSKISLKVDGENL